MKQHWKHPICQIIEQKWVNVQGLKLQILKIQNIDHKLNRVFPRVRIIPYKLRGGKKCQLPKCREKRFNWNFVTYSLFNYISYTPKRIANGILIRSIL